MSEHKPLAIDLYAGLGGWAEGFLSEGYRVIGFDIEAHDYGTGGYPGELVIQDVRSVSGAELVREYGGIPAVIVASPPCQAYSYRAMPWKRAKALPPPDNTLFNECFRIQREACEAAGRYIPLIVENVRGAQKWVGQAKWHFGSYYIWGDVPALMPITLSPKLTGRSLNAGEGKWRPANGLGLEKSDHTKVPSFRFDGSGKSFQTASVRRTNVGNGARFTSRDCGIEAEHIKVGQGLSLSKVGFNVACVRKMLHGDASLTVAEGRKIGGDWFSDPNSTCRKHGSKSNARRDASAQIAKIPFPLAQHIARVFKPFLTSLLLVALLTPAFPQRAAHMFVLSEIARKSYAQFSFDFETSVTGKKSKTEVSSQSPEPPVVSNVPSALDHLAAKYRPFIDRVMVRLSEAERQEINTHYQADYRQSWICLSFANKGMAEPFVSSSYQMYGIHPSKVWERIVADRKERLGAEYYDWYSSDDLLRPDVPKIPPTATADIHAANGADLSTGTVGGSVPINKEVV